MKNYKNTITEIVSFLIIVTYIIVIGDIKNILFIPHKSVDNIINDNFVLFSSKGSNDASNILKDMIYLAGVKTETAKEVIKKDNPDEPVNETPKVEETTINYQNSGTNISWNNVLINNHSSKQVDLVNMMKDYSPISKNDIKILIIHTHGTEGYIECPSSRTEDTEKNVVKVGTVLTDKLKEYGFNVLHDPKMHDLPSYNGSYKNALITLNWYKEHYSGINIVLDVHRDAFERSDGSKVKVISEQNGKKAAQVMFVAGTDDCGLSHPNWQENLKLAAYLYANGNSSYPGFFRPIDLRSERFNQHITNGSLLVEFGSNGNSLDEAVYSAEILADIFNKSFN